MHDGNAEESSKTIRDVKGSQRRVIDTCWPGTSQALTLLYLHCAEQQAAYFAAREWFDQQNQPIDDTAANAFQAELDYQLVYRMVLQPAAKNPKRRLFRDVDEVRRELTATEVTHLVEAHFEEQEREVAVWYERQPDPLMRQLARALDVEETTSPDELLALVTALRLGHEGDDE